VGCEQEALGEIREVLHSKVDSMASLFKEMDKRGTGQIDEEDWASALTKLGLDIPGTPHIQRGSETDTLASTLDSPGAHTWCLRLGRGMPTAACGVSSGVHQRCKTRCCAALVTRRWHDARTPVVRASLRGAPLLRLHSMCVCMCVRMCMRPLARV
jgi:hypothetical protein